MTRNRDLDTPVTRTWEGDTKSGFLLSSDELREIEDGAVRIQAHGGRYAEAAESMTNL